MSRAARCARARTSGATTRWRRSSAGCCAPGWSLGILGPSGRLSFELVQKAALAGARVLVGVSAPTSLAVRLADDRRVTLCGFAREGRVNVYTGAERVR